MQRYQRFFAEQEKQIIRDRSALGWVAGIYSARAVGGSLSRKVKYPDKPLTLVADDIKGKPMTDAERFAAWAEAFNAGMRGRKKEEVPALPETVEAEEALALSEIVEIEEPKPVEVHADVPNAVIDAPGSHEE